MTDGTLASSEQLDNLKKTGIERTQVGAAFVEISVELAATGASGAGGAGGGIRTLALAAEEAVAAAVR